MINGSKTSQESRYFLNPKKTELCSKQLQPCVQAVAMEAGTYHVHSLHHLKSKLKFCYLCTLIRSGLIATKLKRNGSFGQQSARYLLYFRAPPMTRDHTGEIRFLFLPLGSTELQHLS